MFQPRVKLEFVRRYLLAKERMESCVDIDPSEEGRTGRERESRSLKNDSEQCWQMRRVCERHSGR